MNRAAAAASLLLKECWPAARRLVVVCGAGNNGGDGYCVARLAHAAGLSTRVLAVTPTAQLHGDALRAFHECAEARVEIVPFDAAALGDADVVVDAVFGTGLDRPLEAAHRAVIAAVNASERPVLSLDLPSGLHADTGAVMGAAIRATRTITFVGLKSGCFVGHGLELCGSLHFADLDLAEAPENLRRPVMERLDEAMLREHLAPRRRAAHKGDFGRVLIVGGGLGMPGAVRLCGEACLRSGAGLVTVATRGEHAAAIAAGRP